DCTKFTSHEKRPSANLPSKPTLKYQVSTSCSNRRGPTSMGRRVTQAKFELASRAMPNGLNGFSAETVIVSAIPPVPALGPTKMGSGAPRLLDCRLLNRPFTVTLTSSVIAKVMRANIDLRCDGVS